MARANFKIEGMRELRKSLDKLGKTPQKHVTASSKKGMRIPLKKAKADAPYLTGALEQGLILVGEKTKTKGKKIYRVVFDRAMNDVFQKKDSNGKVTAYYPVSQEYGYFTKNGRYIPGFAFTRGALESTAPEVEKTIVQTMKKKIDAEIAQGGLK